MTESPHRSRRPSLRQLLVVVVLLAAAWAALKFASPLLAGVVTAVALLVCGVMAVYAFVERGRRQAFAIGFTVIAAGFTYVQNAYDDGSRYGVMPTEQLLTLLHRQMATKWMYDLSTGERVRRMQPSDASPGSSYDGDSALPAPTFMTPTSPISPVTLPFGNPPGTLAAGAYPSIMDFIAVGNSLWTLLLAYLGGKFAVWVYARRIERESGSSVPASGDT